MGYLHINNLYREQDILMFKECYVLEKIHGTSAHLTFRRKSETDPTVEILYFSGNTKHETFKKLFNEADLIARFTAMALPIDKQMTIYGESYGGKEQGMSHIYGPVGKFVVFDVQINESWLDVPKAEKVATDFGLEFVHYIRVPTELSVLDAWRDAPSVQAIRNGISQLMPWGTIPDENSEDLPSNGINPSDWIGRLVKNPKKREGIVLRPLIELRKNNGERLICKHKGDDFKETATPRPVVDPSKMQVLVESQAVADEWVTYERLMHVLSKLPGHCMERMRDIIAAMIEDVNREGSGEFVPSEAVNKAIGKKTALAYKEYLNSQIGK